jgi:hypothetical protein
MELPWSSFCKGCVTMNPTMKNIEKKTPRLEVNNELPESAEAKYWREKYEVSTRHLMVAVKEWGKLRQQVEEYRSKVA